MNKVDKNRPVSSFKHGDKRVAIPDGTVIWRRAAIDTFIDALRKIGLERIPAVGIQHGGYNLVSKDKRPTMPGRMSATGGISTRTSAMPRKRKTSSASPTTIILA